MATTELTGAEEVAWDLSDLYDGGDDPRIEQDVEQAETAAAAFRELYYGRVAQLSPDELRTAIEEREKIESAFTRAIYYAHLWFSTDMSDSQRGALVARLTEKGAALDTQLLFFGLELAALEDEQADALLASDELERWRHWLRTVRKFRPYILTEPEEKILTEKSVSGFSAWDRLYDELLGAIRVDLDGDEIGFEEAMSKLYSADRDLRRRASEAVTEALAPGLRTRTYIFNTIAVDKSIDDRLRGYATWISSRNLSNDTSDEAVQALVDAVVGRYDVVQRYYKLKARLLGLDRLSFYDRMAPLADDPTQVGWSEASELVLGAFSDFSAETGDVVERFFRESWIDAPPREGKRPGAFCATNVPDVHPYVFMNFTGDRRSVLTLAHELGHGLHGYLAQPLGLFNASTPLDHRRDGVRLRRGAHVQASARDRGGPAPAAQPPRGADRGLDRDRLPSDRDEPLRGQRSTRHGATRASSRRRSSRSSGSTTQTKMFADSVDIDGYGTWWSYIPHFIGTPGYVYAYSYGFLFALSIFRKYELEGDSMVEPYLDLLRAGGSKPPQELAEMVGLDLTDPQIWDAGIDALAAELDEAEALAADVGL